jgi:protein ImuB
VLIDGAARHERVRVVSAGAARTGIRAGMGAAEARARCAALELRRWDEGRLGEAITQVSGLLLGASPQVTPVAGAPGTWWVGARGFDGLGGEQQLAERIRAIAAVWHPQARVAVADACVTARVATWAPWQPDRAITHIPPGRDAPYLARAPLGLLPMDEAMREALGALGLTTIGALAALEPGDVERRFGAVGLAAWRLATGDDPRRPGLVRVEARRSAGAELGGAATTVEPLLFLVRTALERLVRELVADGRAAASVALTLLLDAPRGALPDAGARAPTVTRELRPARPLARVGPLFESCRALLAEWTLPAPVLGVTVSIPATAPLAAEQGDLLVAAWRDQAQQVDAAFARVRAAFGAESVVRPVVRDAHRPDQAGGWEVVTSVEEALERAAPPAASGVAPGAAPGVMAAAPLARPLRLLEVPEGVEVEAPHGAPDAVWWRGARLAVAHAEGPERLRGDWWQGPYARDYWCCRTVPGAAAAADADVGLGGGAALLLYRDDQAGGWYLHGWYD